MAETRQPIMEIPLATMPVQGTVGSDFFQAAVRVKSRWIFRLPSADCHHEI